MISNISPNNIAESMKVQFMLQACPKAKFCSLYPIISGAEVELPTELLLWLITAYFPLMDFNSVLTVQKLLQDRNAAAMGFTIAA